MYHRWVFSEGPSRWKPLSHLFSSCIGHRCDTWSWSSWLVTRGWQPRGGNVNIGVMRKKDGKCWFHEASGMLQSHQPPKLALPKKWLMSCCWKGSAGWVFILSTWAKALRITQGLFWPLIYFSLSNIISQFVKAGERERKKNHSLPKPSRMSFPFPSWLLIIHGFANLTLLETKQETQCSHTDSLMCGS